LLTVSDVLLFTGLAYSLWSLAYLGRSLSILPEARHLVTGGPYGVTRHPLYLGEAIAAVGAALPTLGEIGMALIFLFLCAQYIRAGWEEQVLARHFPVEYAQYRRHVPKLVPDPRRLFQR
jgi:protein-S-isoprenylcysteine O-methyltransferase Ste14